MSQYVYHMVPKDMQGDRLIPLNVLGTTYPHLYEQYTKKYFDHPDRPNLLKRQVPKLHCLWNDVLHFLPMHPFHVYDALTKLEIKKKENLLFFKIPVERLQPNQNALYLYSKENFKGPAEEFDEQDFLLLDIAEYKEMRKIPSETVEYYNAGKKNGKPFGMFHFIPHVLSLGEIDVTNVEIISWNQEEVSANVDGH
ncbi:group-specific protein [Ureibacillus sp. 179-F W5.1 NHS]|uniref:group-specific protein n=1 Tax=Ureibacillus sp. 179-F W5.1 NHS TaxID=3374297 RepID=UPI00387904B4